MFESICLALVLVLMITLMRRGVDVSWALVAGAVSVGIFFGVEWPRLPHGLGAALLGIVVNLAKAAVDPTSLQLIGLVLLITLLGHVLKHVASLQRLIAVLKALLRDRRAAMAAAPAFVGLLPMPGGALFSAPMVGELTEDVEVPSEDRVLINYWFRHVWEWTWPLYPGTLIASTLLHAPLDRLILANAPMTVAAIAIGFFLCFRRVELPQAEAREQVDAGTWRELVAAVWPVGLVVVLTAALAVAKRLGVPLALSTKAALLVALAIVIPVFMAFKRVGRGEAWKLVRATVSLRLIVLVYGVVSFGYMMRAYEAANDLPHHFASWGVPPLVLVFVVPMICGLLMGYTPAFVAISFPVLKPLLMAGGRLQYGYFVLAFAGGFLGVMVSPVHLCLVLSKEYFGADFGRVYRRLLPPVVLLAMAAVGTLLLWQTVGLG